MTAMIFTEASENLKENKIYFQDYKKDYDCYFFVASIHACWFDDNLQKFGFCYKSDLELEKLEKFWDRAKNNIFCFLYRYKKNDFVIECQNPRRILKKLDQDRTSVTISFDQISKREGLSSFSKFSSKTFDELVAELVINSK